MSETLFSVEYFDPRTGQAAPGKAVNGGFGLVLDGSERVERILDTALEWDAMGGVARRAWARNAGAEFAAKQAMARDTDLKVTLPAHAEDLEGLVSLALLVSGPVGNHGVAVMLAREAFGMRGDLKSDAASVLPLTQAALAVENARFYQRERARAQELELLRKQRERGGTSP